MAGAEGLAVVVEAPEVSEATVREGTPDSLLQRLGRLARGGSADDLVAGGFEAGPYRRESRSLPAAGHADYQVKRMPRS